jgi:hypothetical protein
MVIDQGFHVFLRLVVIEKTADYYHLEINLPFLLAKVSD